MKTKFLLSDKEIEEIADYALNPSNWGHRHKKESKMEDVENLLESMAKSLKRVREDYLKYIEEKAQEYMRLLN